MATYKQITQQVQKTDGFAPKSCWIADVLSSHGLTKRIASNRNDPRKRQHSCPPDKRPAIESALRHFQKI